MDAYKNIDLQHIELIKYQPLYEPSVTYLSDTSYNYNYLKGKLFQFCYRWVYDLKEKSVFSPYSELLIPQYNELPNGNFVEDYTLNNIIAVKINMGNEMVDKIEIAVREGNLGNLYIFKKIKKHLKQSFNARFIKDRNFLYGIGLNGGLTIDDLHEGFIIETNQDGITTNYQTFEETYIVNIDKTSGRVYLNNTLHFDGSLLVITFYPDIKEEERYVIFNGIEEKITVPDVEARENYDNVPLLSGSMEIIEKDRLLLGDNTSGFNKTEIIARLESVDTQIGAYTDSGKFNITYLNTDLDASVFFLILPSTIDDNSIISITINFSDLTTATTNLQKKSSDTIVGLVNEIISSLTTYFVGDESHHDTITTVQNLINTSGLDYAYSTYREYGGILGTTFPFAIFSGNVYIVKREMGGFRNIPPSGNTTDTPFWTYAGPLTSANIMIFGLKSLNKTISTLYPYIYKPQYIYPIFKYGDEKLFAIEYVDHAGRTTGVLRSDSLRFKNKDYSDFESYSPAIINNLTIKLSNQPPDFAYAYRILMAKTTPWFFQFYFNGLSNADPDITLVGDKYHIKINRSLQVLIDSNKKVYLSSYIFQKGDRIRIIGKYRPERWFCSSYKVDLEIEGYDYPEETASYKKDNATGDDQDFLKDANGNKIRETSREYIIIKKPANYSVFTGHYILYEIYRPVVEASENTPFYRISKTYEIGDPGQATRYHKGDVDQVIDTTPAECNINRGDVYRKVRYSGVEGIAFPVESMNLSDFYKSDSISIGRSNIDFGDIGEIREISKLLPSEKYIENTEINGLTKFYPENSKKLTVENGKITGVVLDGYILRVLQDRKITSIYIGRTVIQDQKGNDQITMLKDQVFGTDFEFNSDNGCQDKRSIIKTPKHIYFQDNNYGSWHRIAYNGVFEISLYGMSNYFHELIQGFNYSSKKHLAVGYDKVNDELLVSYRYMETDDNTLFFTGKLNNGNTITKIGYKGGNLITVIEVGMNISNAYDVFDNAFPDDTYITKIDIKNKTIYFNNNYDSSIPDDSEFTFYITKKYNITTLAFHEEVNAWKTRFPYVSDFFGSIKNSLLTFGNNKIWLHNAGTLYNNFHGIQYNQELTIPFNIDPKSSKLLKGIVVISNRPWGFKNKGDITCKAYDRNDDIDMESLLPIAKFKKVQGKYVSEFLRDMNTPGYDSDNEALINGRFLNGQAISLKLSNEETNQVVLFGIIIYFSPNENF